jgi:hypothetical protein
MLLVILCVASLSYLVAKSVNRSLRDCSPSCSSRRRNLPVVGIALKAKRRSCRGQGTTSSGGPPARPGGRKCHRTPGGGTTTGTNTTKRENSTHKPTDCRGNVNSRRPIEMNRRRFSQVAAAALSFLPTMWSWVLAPTRAAGAARSMSRVRPGDPAWPSEASWDRLSRDVGGGGSSRCSRRSRRALKRHQAPAVHMSSRN